MKTGLRLGAVAIVCAACACRLGLQDGLEPGRAEVRIGGEKTWGSATLGSEEIGGQVLEAVVLDLGVRGQVKIWSRQFEVGKRVRENNTEDAAFLAMYVPAGGKHPYAAENAVITILQLDANAIEGSVRFETWDALASCARCSTSRGPDVQGRFRAWRSDAAADSL